MSSNRLFVVAACAVPLSIAACGGSDSGGTIVPEGPHHGYVVNSVTVPASTTEAMQFGLDFGSKTSSMQDGTPDNALGNLLGTLVSLAHFDIQTPVTEAVTHGSLILLVDLQAKDLANASAAGFSIKYGANPTPAACSGPTDMTCGHHLDGSASFTIAPGSPTDALVTGKIVSGSFSGGPGDLALQIVLGSTTPIDLNLLHARVQATGISDTGIMTATVGGLVTQTELTTQLAPAIQTQITAILDRDCPARTAPSCSCTVAGSTGAQVLTLLDANMDCQITVEEILGNPLVGGLLLPDSCSMDTCTKADSLSLAVKVTAVKATFPM